MIYKIYVTMQFGYDDTYDAEYSGIEYTSKEEAKKELIAAKKFVKNDRSAHYAYIKEFEF